MTVLPKIVGEIVADFVIVANPGTTDFTCFSSPSVKTFEVKDTVYPLCALI